MEWKAEYYHIQDDEEREIVRSDYHELITDLCRLGNTIDSIQLFERNSVDYWSAIGYFDNTNVPLWVKM